MYRMTSLVDTFPLIRRDTLELMDTLREIPELEELTDAELMGIDIEHFGFGDDGEGAVLVVNGRIEINDGQRFFVHQADNYIELSEDSACFISQLLEYKQPMLTGNLELVSEYELPITVAGSREPLYRNFLFYSWNKMMLMQELQHEKTKLRKELKQTERDLGTRAGFFVFRD